MASPSFGRFFLKTLGVLAFCAVSGYALFLAYGYNVDLQNQHIEKTSIIDVVNRYPELRVYLDDKLVGNSLPVQMKDLLPGTYDLTISKLGYLPWSRPLKVQTDIVTKVDDVILVPEHPDTLVQQLVHFPEQSSYFFGDDFFVVLNPGNDYLTIVYLMKEGAIKEEELKLSRKDIKAITPYDPEKLLVTFQDDSYEWVEFNGPRFVDFTLPKGTSGLTFLPSRNAVYFINGKNLYRAGIDKLTTLTSKNLQDFLLVRNVDQYDVHEGRLVYLSGGVAFTSDDTAKTSRILDRSHAITYVRYLPFQSGQGGLYVARNSQNKRLLYAVNERGVMTLLTPQLKGEAYLDDADRALFGDESGNVFMYRPLLKKKFLVSTLPTDVNLLGFMFGDGHFLFTRDKKVFLSDSSFTNVYQLLDYQENGRYFLSDGAVFSLADHKLKSLFLLPKN